jgi:hypothetical protein
MLLSQKSITNSIENSPPVLFVCVVMITMHQENVVEPQMGNENEPMNKQSKIIYGNSEMRNSFKIKN